MRKGQEKNDRPDLRARRLELGASVAEIARRADLQWHTVARIEDGGSPSRGIYRTGPHARSIRRLTEALTRLEEEKDAATTE